MKKIHTFDEVFHSQQLFREILFAMANPLQSVDIQEFADQIEHEYNGFLALAMTLLDNEVTFNTCENQVLSDGINTFTLSERETLSKADFIFVDQEKDLEMVIQQAKTGTLESPHQSATIIVKTSAKKNRTLTMKGPGINEKITVEINRLVDYCINLRDNLFFEYPKGIDFIFVDTNNQLLGIPRLAKKEVFL